MKKIIEILTYTGGELAHNLADDFLIEGEYTGSSYAAICTECGEPVMTIEGQEIYFLVEESAVICEHCAAKLITNGDRIIDKRDNLIDQDNLSKDQESD